jgi:zeaxanthin glucosyltransferase
MRRENAADSRMYSVGIITPPVQGHILPFAALGRELIARGHRVTAIQMPDAEERVLAEGLEFIAIGERDHPRGSLPESLAQLGRLQGLAALRFTIEAVRRTTEMLCRDAPAVIEAAGIEMLLVDQTEPGGGTIAEHLGLPFVTICNALALNREPAVPPPFTPWTAGDRWWQKMRNAAGYAVSAQVTAPVSRVVANYRRRWKLPAQRRPEDSFSKLAQISQQPAEFDFPRRELPACFRYTGPLRDQRIPEGTFPWHQLDGRALVYASLGTLQHSKENVFRCIAEACAELKDVQLVMAHGGSLSEAAIRSLPGDPIGVVYAPQASLLQRARLAVTHAGLNTVLDALRFGVPMVAIPITYEQPAIAARVVWTGTGESLPLRKLTASRLRETMRQVLDNPGYAEQSGRMAASIERAGGVEEAARIIETVARKTVPAYR